MVDKGFGKYQLLDTIYSKENGVHVRQLGQVYMYGSQDRCTCMAVRLGVGQVRCWLGQVRLGQVRQGQVRLGQVRLGQVRLGQVRQGSLGHEQVRQIKLFTISIGKKLTFSVYMSHEKVSFARHCRANDTFFVNCSNPVQPGLTGFEQLINFVSSS